MSWLSRKRCTWPSVAVTLVVVACTTVAFCSETATCTVAPLTVWFCVGLTMVSTAGDEGRVLRSGVGEAPGVDEEPPPPPPQAESSTSAAPSSAISRVRMACRVSSLSGGDVEGDREVGSAADLDVVPAAGHGDVGDE